MIKASFRFSEDVQIAQRASVQSSVRYLLKLGKKYQPTQR
jgi:hypothetical protein